MRLMLFFLEVLKKRFTEEEILKQMEASVPVKRIGDPAEYGYLVTFLASDHAAYITGTQIPIDGGSLSSL